MTEAATSVDQVLISRAEFSRRCGWGKPYTHKLEEQGRLVLADGGKLVDYHASLARIQQTTGAPERAAEPAVTPGFSNSRERREWAESEKAVDELKKSRGELVRTEDVRAAVANAAATLRGQLEALPDQLAPQLANMSDETAVRNLLVAEIERVLNDMAHGFGRAGEIA